MTKTILVETENPTQVVYTVSFLNAVEAASKPLAREVLRGKYHCTV